MKKRIGQLSHCKASCFRYLEPVLYPTFREVAITTNSVPSGRKAYAEAGVDIDAGNALVEAIKPLAKATARAGADAGLGGFGALFDLKAAGYRDPILVSTTDGVGTKLKIAIETNLFDGVGIDLVAMCVNDLIVQGAEPFAVPRLLCQREVTGGCRAARHRGYCGRLQAGRMRPVRRRNRRNARHVWRW